MERTENKAKFQLLLLPQDKKGRFKAKEQGFFCLVGWCLSLRSFLLLNYVAFSMTHNFMTAMEK